MPNNIIFPLVPPAERDSFLIYFNRMNTLVDKFNSIMRRLTPIQPTTENYADCERIIREMSTEVDTYLNSALALTTDLFIYGINIQYDYTGSDTDNFIFLDYKILLREFSSNIKRQSDTVLKSINDIESHIKSIENISLTSSLVGKIAKFAKHHPIYFYVGNIIHVAVILVGLRELVMEFIHWIWK